MTPLKNKTAEVHQQQVIHSYTRREAIENGEQILASGELANIARSIGYKYPVYQRLGLFRQRLGQALILKIFIIKIIKVLWRRWHSHIFLNFIRLK
jgi:hypothetical protein